MAKVKRKAKARRTSGSYEREIASLKKRVSELQWLMALGRNPTDTLPLDGNQHHGEL